MDKWKHTGDGEPFKKAVALTYDYTQNPSPRVAARGKGYLAEKILQLARESGVPIHRDKTLVNMLIKLDLGDFIPTPLYRAVAEILAFVYRMEQKAKNPR